MMLNSMFALDHHSSIRASLLELHLAECYQTLSLRCHRYSAVSVLVPSHDVYIR